MTSSNHEGKQGNKQSGNGRDMNASAKDDANCPIPGKQSDKSLQGNANMQSDDSRAAKSDTARHEDSMSKQSGNDVSRQGESKVGNGSGLSQDGSDAGNNAATGHSGPSGGSGRSGSGTSGSKSSGKSGSKAGSR
ncbi:MAG: hypothetical protein V4857_23980 [Pseudomonadota bacterium]